MGSADFAQDSYARHESHFQSYAQDGEKAAHARPWLDDDTVDAWRHTRMHRSIDPLLDAYPDGSWLTVGDGRFGNEAHYIQQQGVTVLATDISDTLLQEAKESGYIKDYRKENAECLSFADASFDFVLCKEAYHHMPRPMIALYEMLRVAAKGVVLIEPNDPGVFDETENLVGFVHNSIRKLLRRQRSRHCFEEVGNYVYGISKREIEKAALGMNLQTVAFKGICDHFVPNLGSEKAIAASRPFRKVRSTIAFRERMMRWGLLRPGLIVAVIFKFPPDGDLRGKLAASGYQVVDLPANPYV